MSEPAVTQQDVNDARALILDCTTTALLSGEKSSAQKLDAKWIRERLLDAAGRLVGSVSAVPADMVMVPREPTPEMIAAVADDMLSDAEWCRSIYRAMIDAARGKA